MQYMCLIYADENRADAYPELSSPEQEKMMAAYMAFGQEAAEAGVMITGDALMGTATATTVRVRGEDALQTDGPFAETKEQLGGYYLLECENLDEALKWAAKIPTAAFGSIEVRPVMVFDQP
jgi:hypothetical protein